jgi:DNA anti-recombination protein RmuC
MEKEDIYVDNQVLQMLKEIMDKVDHMDGRLDKMDNRLDNMDGRLNRIEKELTDFREETRQNFSVLVENDARLQRELNQLSTKLEEETNYLNLKTDVMQKEILKIKRQ